MVIVFAYQNGCYILKGIFYDLKSDLKVCFILFVFLPDSNAMALWVLFFGAVFPRLKCALTVLELKAIEGNRPKLNSRFATAHSGFEGIRFPHFLFQISP